MLIYLAKKTEVTFTGNVGQSSGDWNERKSSVPVTLIPADVNNEDEMTKLEKKLGYNSASRTNTGGSRAASGPRNLAIEMGFYNSTTTTGRPSNVSNSSIIKGFIGVTDTSSKGILEGLSQVYGKGQVKLTVQVENFKKATLGSGFNSLTPQLISITEENVDITPTNLFGVEKSELDVKGNISLDQWTQNQYQGDRWEVCLTIIAVVPDDYTDIDSSVTDKLSTNKKLLMEQVCCDATIIAENGVSVKCHKAFLAVNSAVLATMFQTEMQESQTSTVKMPDMSEASVRALLAYLYHWETKEAAKNCLICFELFAAGHKYDISQLENCMEKILLLKNSDWYYDVDVAIKLFLFSRNLGGSGDRLKMKAIQVLKTKFSDLSESACYKQLFKKDPEAAMDLCKYAFSV